MHEAALDAETLSKTFKEFAYVVSHDLGTPLRAMVEFSRLLKAEEALALDEESRLYLSMIIENGEKAQAMMGGLLEYSRLNTVVMPLTMTDCNMLFRQCLLELNERIASHNATITADTFPGLPVDAGQVKRLLIELVTNAITFHAPGVSPRVAVSVQRGEDGIWLFSVKDNGIGIDPKFHERIFQPFKRLHPDGEFPGIGMGLALAKKIVSRHGGRIWVESQPGRGAAFYFTLPEKQGGA